MKTLNDALQSIDDEIVIRGHIAQIKEAIRLTDELIKVNRETIEDIEIRRDDLYGKLDALYERLLKIK